MVGCKDLAGDYHCSPFHSHPRCCSQVDGTQCEPKRCQSDMDEETKKREEKKEEGIKERERHTNDGEKIGKNKKELLQEHVMVVKRLNTTFQSMNELLG